MGSRRPKWSYSGLCSGKIVLLHLLPINSRNEDDETMGQITSVAVCREYRRLGLANKLMRQSQIKMIEIYNCKTCALHVRESNYAARHMYEEVLGFKYVTFLIISNIYRLSKVEDKYYGDGENGLSLKLDLVELRESLGLPPFKGLKPEKKSEEKKSEETPKNRKPRNKKR